MAETSRRHLPKQPLDLEKILQEAKHRWLRPTEILEILSNYRLFPLTPEPPLRPPAGSLFLFDRKSLRYFRKDGHRWRKKKDGKTVREAHEKLKAGSVDVLHCYYAHGEDNNNFQRRCYWMLAEGLDHIVLVHYLEVREGYKSSVSPLLTDSLIQIESSQPITIPSLAEVASPTSISLTSDTSTTNRIDWNREATLSSEFENVNMRNCLKDISLNESAYNHNSNDHPLSGSYVEGLCVLSKNSNGSWARGVDEGRDLSFQCRNLCGLPNQNFAGGQSGVTDYVLHNVIDARVDGPITDSVVSEDGLITLVDNQDVKATSQGVIQEYDFNLIPPHLHNHTGSDAIATSTLQEENNCREGNSNNDDRAEFKRLDSFGKWMDEQIGGDCDGSLMASDSGKYWSTLDTENDEKEVSSFSRHLQLDIDSLGPSLSQEQLFSISDFSPEWACCGVETKVIIFGAFLGSKKLSDEIKWGCMFGEVEVLAEILTDSSIRCYAPPHAAGRVPFYVTCRNRLACSEVREFEYREIPSKSIHLLFRSIVEEEVRFQVRLAKFLTLDQEKKWLDCSNNECNGCKLRSTVQSKQTSEENDCKKDNMSCRMYEGGCLDSRDKLIQKLLKDKLCEWLVYRIHEGGKGPDILDEEGQGVIHLAAGLGYNWALSLIINARGNPNFRDSQGRTALHWASYFGREQTVVELVKLGVDPTAVDDPTSTFPGGKSAADLASSQGHKGIAAYLAEAFLARHLSLLNMKENLMDSVDAVISTEEVTEVAADAASQSSKQLDGELSLRGSLAAVRKSAHAAALIQSVYRANSFCYRQLHKSNTLGNDTSELALDLAALGPLCKAQKSHFQDYLHFAAVKIQQKYRGWKGRKEFIKIRDRIVKIQAHVRAHQARKQYKRVVWSVGIVEKAILRWRRKGAGLRGFRVEKPTTGKAISETDKNDEYDFLRVSRKQKVVGVENALARVKSMVRYPEARDQYMRLVTKFENLKVTSHCSLH
ncbi:hypothetical protein K2173_022405 [Erythroxylum novogranatense]|uniref:CG-1 domain-containing protein n=1 Tax=Erythroxylum novogranatense TaxID=1862640 RepID=A0AAV8THI5_9ROSI|nr:hypothetical protein K2173_022405 [Erythroxylum novogranatense]